VRPAQVPDESLALHTRDSCSVYNNMHLQESKLVQQVDNQVHYSSPSEVAISPCCWTAACHCWRHHQWDVGSSCCCVHCQGPTSQQQRATVSAMVRQEARGFSPFSKAMSAICDCRSSWFITTCKLRAGNTVTTLVEPSAALALSNGADEEAHISWYDHNECPGSVTFNVRGCCGKLNKLAKIVLAKCTGAIHQGTGSCRYPWKLRESQKHPAQLPR